MLEKAGAWYSHQGTKIGQGKANSARFLEENPELCNSLEQQIRAQLLTTGAVAAREETDADALED